MGSESPDQVSEDFRKYEPERMKIAENLEKYSQSLRSLAGSSIGKETVIEGVSGGVGAVKGVIDGYIIRTLTDGSLDNARMVEINLGGGLHAGIPVTDLPGGFGENGPLVGSEQGEWWVNLCRSLGVKAQKLAPIAGFVIGLAVGSVISTVYGWRKDSKIIGALEDIVSNVENVDEEPLVYSKLKSAAKRIKSYIRGALGKIKGVYRKIKTLGRTIKSVGTMIFAYLAIRFIYNVISLLLGLNNVPDIINTVEEANYWAKFVYDTIMTAKDLMPVAEQYAPIVLAGATGSYGVGKGLEWYGNRKIARTINYISDQINELKSLYTQQK